MHELTLAGLVLSLAFPLTACSSVVTDSDAVSATIIDANGAPIVGARVAIGAGTTASVPGLAAGVKRATVEMPPHPVLTSPKEGDTPATGSEIRWSIGNTRANIVAIRPADFSSHEARYFIATSGESVVVPDVAALGLHLPGGAKYQVTVERDSWTATVDDAAATPWEAGFEKKPYDRATSGAAGVVIQ
jgi:hypothetical protein